MVRPTNGVILHCALNRYKTRLSLTLWQIKTQICEFLDSRDSKSWFVLNLLCAESSAAHKRSDTRHRSERWAAAGLGQAWCHQLQLHVGTAPSPLPLPCRCQPKAQGGTLAELPNGPANHMHLCRADQATLRDASRQSSRYYKHSKYDTVWRGRKIGWPPKALFCSILFIFFGLLFSLWYLSSQNIWVWHSSTSNTIAITKTPCQPLGLPYNHPNHSTNYPDYYPEHCSNLLKHPNDHLKYLNNTIATTLKPPRSPY